jgi:hypothetical protein
MKRILLCIATALMLCAVSCGEKQSESQTDDESSIETVMIPLEMPDIDISIPEDYEETSTENNSTVYVRNDASIIVNSDEFTEEYQTLDEYVSYAESIYRTYSDNVEILGNDERNGGHITEFIYSLNSENGVFSKYCMVAYFTDGEKIYIVTCKADSDTYSDYRDEFLDVIDSVNIIS